MADYWKSQPRKFCQYCKCWIADNKPSVEFHERGKNHKENVAAKISEIKKKSIDKAKQEEKQCKAFAAMEEAAMKAYQEDLKRMEREAAGLPPEATPAITTAPKPPPLVVNVTKEEWKKQQKKAKEGKKPGKQTAAQVWVEGQTDDGHTYYYNTITGESQWEKPGGSSASTQTPQPQTQSSSRGLWLEATSPEGYTYYYNTDSGETSWEKPADLLSNEASGSNTEGGAEEKEQNQEEPEPPQLEPLSGGEESSGGAPAPQEAEVPEQANKKSNVPKISFRKRKAEAEPSEKEGEDKAGDDASTEVRKEEEQQRTTAEPEEKKEEKVTQTKKPKTTNPYGSWEQIQQEEDPYSSVDLQLPQVEGSSTGAPDELPPEPKPKFKERVITSLGDEGGPASFRKTKTQNGKSRSIRQRDNDD